MGDPNFCPSVTGYLVLAFFFFFFFWADPFIVLNLEFLICQSNWFNLLSHPQARHKWEIKEGFCKAKIFLEVE